MYIKKISDDKHNLLSKYIHYSNLNLFSNKIRYTPCSSCGLGNKLLGLISSLAYGISYSVGLKVINWDSLWWYFDFPIHLDKTVYIYNLTFVGHFYGIKDVIVNKKTRNFLIQNNLITYNTNLNIMVNSLAYKISSLFLRLNSNIEFIIREKFTTILDFGIHIRTGKADGKEFLLHYLKYKDINRILNYISLIQKNGTVYISSDSSTTKTHFINKVKNGYYLNTSTCNSGYGLLKKRNRCAIEAIIDYYILSKCKFLILTKCSSFSLISLFANEIGFNNQKLYVFFGNCTIHSDLYK